MPQQLSNSMPIHPEDTSPDQPTTLCAHAAHTGGGGSLHSRPAERLRPRRDKATAQSP